MCRIHFFIKLSKMPKCKNNPSRHYKGHEPSPKGNGWCASGESIGKKRKGTDGKMWIVKQTKTSKRWIPCTSNNLPRKKRKRTTTPRATSSKKLKKSTQITTSLSITFQYYDETKPKVNKTQLTKFFKSKETIKFLNNCQSAGIAIDNVNGERLCYNKTIKFMSRNVKKVISTKTSICVKYCGEVINYIPIYPNKEKLIDISNREDFLQHLKETINYVIGKGDGLLIGDKYGIYISKIE